jgi:hypothetical protein
MLVRNALFAILVVLIAFSILKVARQASPQIDCGPEGKLVANGTACIDKHPVMVP